MVPNWRREEDRILGAWYHQTRATSIRAESQQSPRDSKEEFNKVVLEAWCYTRAAEPEVVHVAATGFQGIPDCVARYKFPRRWRRLDLYQQQQGALIPTGLRHLYQGSVGDGKHWITGIQGSHGVIDLNFVYTLSLLVSVYTVTWFNVYTRRVISITPVPLRRWALGRPIHSCRAVMAALSGGLPGSVSPHWRGCLRLAGIPNLHNRRR